MTYGIFSNCAHKTSVPFLPGQYHNCHRARAQLLENKIWTLSVSVHKLYYIRLALSRDFCARFCNKRQSRHQACTDFSTFG